MKKFLQSLPQVLVNLCGSYTCTVLLYTLLDAQQATMRRAWLYEILAICAAATVLQYVFFSGKVVKRLSYLARMAWFAAAMLAVVCVIWMAKLIVAKDAQDETQHKT